MKYTKPELFTEQFDVEDVITASSGTPGTDPGTDPGAISYDPWELTEVNPFG